MAWREINLSQSGVCPSGDLGVPCQTLVIRIRDVGERTEAIVIVSDVHREARYVASSLDQPADSVQLKQWFSSIADLARKKATHVDMSALAEMLTPAEKLWAGPQLGTSF